MLAGQTLNHQLWGSLGLPWWGKKVAEQRELKIVSTAQCVGSFLFTPTVVLRLRYLSRRHWTQSDTGNYLPFHQPQVTTALGNGPVEVCTTPDCQKPCPE
jgi:hypothetical protein